MPVPTTSEARQEVEDIKSSIRAMAERMGVNFVADDEKQQRFISAVQQQTSSQSDDD